MEEQNQNQIPQEQVQPIGPKSSFSKSILILIVVIFIFIIILTSISVYFFLNSKKETLTSTSQSIFTYEECVKLSDSKVQKTYPRICETKDKITFVEKIKEPIDTSSWKTVDTGFGFFLRYPQVWEYNRSEADEKYIFPRVSIYNKTYSGGGTDLTIINPKNFQQSFIRHPNYNNPIDWFNDLKEKKEEAVKVLPKTILTAPGTDGIGYPEYKDYDLNKVIDVPSINEKAVFIGMKDDERISIDSRIFIPLNKTDLLVLDHPKNDPISKAIIASIELSTPSSQNKTTPTPRTIGDDKQTKACTQEAMICPDGSAVGRTGPDCEFAPCPTRGL